MKNKKQYHCAVKYWVENNSSDTYSIELYKFGQGTIFSWDFPTCAEPTITQLQNIISNNALDLAKIAKKDQINKKFKKIYEKSNTSEYFFSSTDLLTIFEACDTREIDTLTQTQLIDIIKEIWEYRLSIYRAKKVKDEEVDAATTVEQVQAITLGG